MDGHKRNFEFLFLVLPIQGSRAGYPSFNTVGTYQHQRKVVGGNVRFLSMFRVVYLRSGPPRRGLSTREFEVPENLLKFRIYRVYNALIDFDADSAQHTLYKAQQVEICHRYL
jgi:hypothetical protein